ncbi:MAG: cation transporter [Pseudomonadales bacterium]|nr:cation transporter [Pseudomonadales bacterium]
MLRDNTETRQLLVLSGIVDLGLGGLKILVGLLANSWALVADGIHSLSDLATDIMVWFFNRIGVMEPDEDHPYGHARFETFGTFLLGGLLIAVAAWLIYDNVLRLMDISEAHVPSWPALVAAAVSVLGKEWLYQITRKLGERTRSKLLIANAWHHRSDSLSSVIVFVGVGGAMFGLLWLEMVAAIGVALMIGKIGYDLARHSILELVDTAQSETYVEELQKAIQGVEGVRGVHSIRTRRMGPDVLVDIHLQVESRISVSEGHHIGEWVSRQLLDDFEEINDVIVHIDAEDDEIVEPRQAPSEMLPLRREVRGALIEAWKDRINPADIQKLILHYLNHGVNVEVFLARHGTPPEHGQLEAELMQLGKDLPWLRRVNIWYD